MSNELALISQQAVLDTIHGTNADVPMNPFEKEIKLASFVVAGTLYGEQLRGLAIRLSEGTAVKLVREPDNRDDKFAIRVEAVGKKLGYVPSAMSEIPSSLMDAGKHLYGRIKKCTISYVGADIIVELFMRG